MKTVAVLSAVLMASAVLPARAQGALPAESFTLKQSAPSLGSNIRRENVTSSMPLNRRWADLAPEHQRSFKSQYEVMGNGDEPPFPLEGLVAIYEPLKKGMEKLGSLGSLEMHVEIDATGEAREVKVLHSPDSRMTRYAASVLMLTKYKPALCAGVPCAMAMPIRVDFKRLP